MIRLQLILVTLVIIIAPIFKAAGYEELDVEFTQITNGHSCLRDSDDRLYSAVIWNAEGYDAFMSEYQLKLPDIELPFEESYIYIFGFSDNANAVVCDGFSHQRYKEMPYYYLDLRETGPEFGRIKPEQGKKYSSWVLIRIHRPIAIAHVAIRENVYGGLCKQFGDK